MSSNLVELKKEIISAIESCENYEDLANVLMRITTQTLKCVSVNEDK